MVAREDELLLFVDGEERKLLEVEVELDARLELVDDKERLELETAVGEEKLELVLLVDDAVELLIDVDNVVGEETCKLEQRDGGCCPVRNVVIATDSVIA